MVKRNQLETLREPSVSSKSHKAHFELEFEVEKNSQKQLDLKI